MDGGKVVTLVENVHILFVNVFSLQVTSNVVNESCTRFVGSLRTIEYCERVINEYIGGCF